MKTILLTGSSGFIGSRIAELLLAAGYAVIGVDDMNEYYDSRLKQHRLDQMPLDAPFRFVKGDVQFNQPLESILEGERVDAIIHSAALAGIRHSQERPQEYVAVNIGGTSNLLSLAQKHNIRRIVFASSSSVYSGCQIPFREDSVSDTPISTYGATKKSGELLAHSYHALYGTHVVVLRYFTIYGPRGRPDMSYFRFIRSLTEGRSLDIHGSGTQTRDLTFVEDAARATISALGLDGYHVLNIAGGRDPISVNEMVRIIETIVGKKATKRYGKSLSTDLAETQADISLAKSLIRWEPQLDFEAGIRTTIEWHMKNREFVRGLKD